MRPDRIETQPGQESVWDYPRPPACEPTDSEVIVIHNGLMIAKSRQCHRVLETSHPPVLYIPPEDVRLEVLVETNNATWCEWKGRAVYYDIRYHGELVAQAAWSYPSPNPEFSAIQNHLAFYPSRVDQCLIDGETVEAQPGDFYGGWITKRIVGPFKGSPGTHGW